MIKIINRKKNRQNANLSRKKIRSSNKWVRRLMTLFFVVTVIFALFFSNFLSITIVKISGLNKVEEMPIREIISKELNSKYAGIVEKNNLILFPPRKFKKELLEKFHWIEDVKIKKKFPTEIELIIKEKKFTMFICSRNECYLLNERGEVCLSENFTTEELEKEKLIKLNDLSEARIDQNFKPLKAKFLKFILQVGGRVWEETGVVIKRQYETPSRMSEDLKVETEAGWKIYFGTNVGIEKELAMLKAILTHKIEKEQQKELEYIDLRIANKVFYKFKEETEQSEEVKAISTPEVKKIEKNKKKKD